jgi:ABC-type proline/glycine betaine transport system substrate-binding protein
MKQLIGLLLLTFAVQPMLAKDNYPLTIKVLKTQNIEKQHGSFNFSKFGGIANAGWSHEVAEHVMAEGSDGNTYELVPDNSKDMLTPGTFQAKIEKHDMKVCEPKDNGKCRDVKFKVVRAEPTPAPPQTPAPTK